MYPVFSCNLRAPTASNMVRSNAPELKEPSISTVTSEKFPNVKQTKKSEDVLQLMAKRGCEHNRHLDSVGRVAVRMYWEPATDT